MGYFLIKNKKGKKHFEIFNQNFSNETECKKAKDFLDFLKVDGTLKFKVISEKELKELLEIQ